jgi:predicted nucleic acid-binding protein
MSVLPSGPLLFDTSMYIRLSRGGGYAWIGEASIFRRTVLTAVVAAELYAGARDYREKRALDRLCRAHLSLGHLVSPPATSWIETGILLRRASTTFGHMDFVHHFRDLLIALDAAREEATLVTENTRDFERWRSLLASTNKTLRLFDPSSTRYNRDWRLAPLANGLAGRPLTDRREFPVPYSCAELHDYWFM